MPWDQCALSDYAAGHTVIDWTESSGCKKLFSLNSADSQLDNLLHDPDKFDLYRLAGRSRQLHQEPGCMNCSASRARFPALAQSAVDPTISEAHQSGLAYGGDRSCRQSRPRRRELAPGWVRHTHARCLCDVVIVPEADGSDLRYHVVG